MSNMRFERAAVNFGFLDPVTGAKQLATATVAGDVKRGVAVANDATAVPAVAPAGGTGTAAGGYDTAVNRDAMITTVNGLRANVLALQTTVNALLAAARTAGQLAP